MDIPLRFLERAMEQCRELYQQGKVERSLTLEIPEWIDEGRVKLTKVYLVHTVDGWVLRINK